MAKKKNVIEYDSIFVTLVPRIVDTNPQIFEDDKEYWDYSVEQVHKFLGRLPVTYRGEISEQRIETEKAAVFRCNGSPYDLMVGFKPAYQLLIVSPDDKRQAFSSDDCIDCPTFDVGFKPKDEEGTRKILQVGLEQFFLLQGDIDDGTLAVIGVKDKKVVYKDLELLRRFLPNRTKIEARCNYGAGNGEATYRL